MENKNQPIHPMPHTNQDGTIQHDVYFGLSKREYFAGLAMQGMLANPVYSKNTTAWNKKIVKGFMPSITKSTNGPDRDDISRVAIAHADELLSQLTKQKPTMNREYTPEELAEVEKAAENIWRHHCVGAMDRVYKAVVIEALKQAFQSGLAHRLHSKQQPWISEDDIKVLADKIYGIVHHCFRKGEAGERAIGYVAETLISYLPSPDGSVQEMFTKEQMIAFGEFCKYDGIIDAKYVVEHKEIPKMADVSDLLTQFNQQTKGGNQ